jgi:EAL domain-containing protein (putative c-di-GMP-specific phosphodiesterase class I)
VSGDELSGPGGVAAFVAALDRQAAVARRYHRSGAVILIGCRGGDERACRAAAAALQARLRRTDVVAVVGPAEIGVLLLEAAPAAAVAVAHDVVALAQRAGGGPAAAGVVSFPEARDRSGGALLAEADAALAVAWRRTPPVSGVPRHVRWPASRADRLAAALADGGMALERRAVVDLRTGVTDHVVVGALPHDAELARPDGMRGTAERFGLGRELDRWLVDVALAAADRDAASLVVPVGAGAAADSGFWAWLAEALAARPYAAARLVLAVPEAAAAADPAAVSALAGRTAQFGTRLALDDAGVLGAVGLLHRLPVHQVRLHPGLVRGLPRSDAARAVVLALVQTAEALGTVPVATGVADQAELTAVRGFGIALAEGAALSRR